MITLPIDLSEPMTEDDLDKLGSLADIGVRYELDNGRLILMAPMKSWNAGVSVRVRNLLVARGQIAYLEQGVRLSRTKVRYPDVAVFRTEPDPEASRHDPADIALVAEVVSPDSDHEDRVVKPALYAAAEISEYWIADRHPSDPRDAVVEFFRVGAGGGYDRMGSAVLSELEAKPV